MLLLKPFFSCLQLLELKPPDSPTAFSVSIVPQTGTVAGCSDGCIRVIAVVRVCCQVAVGVA